MERDLENTDWASVFGPSMSELIDRILKFSKHEEQAFNVNITGTFTPLVRIEETIVPD